ncbi:hypothetical protein KM043_016930 [Ampulex compressa]|nr:hypothetical protein KM043_016930 [Ampulex compressa]
MSNSVRSTILKKILASLGNTDDTLRLGIASSLCVCPPVSATSPFSFTLPVRCKKFDLSSAIHAIVQNHNSSPFLRTELRSDLLIFYVPRDNFLICTIEENFSNPPPPNLISSPKKLLIEFSSPNIAKSFHMGHLRSTVIGNYISNLCSYLSHHVKRINYLGDWGTQYGFVQLGLELKPYNAANETSIKALHRAYVEANTLAEERTSLRYRATELFDKLEKGDTELNRTWETVRQRTMKELCATYARFGVTFDEYHWESTYRLSEIGSLVDKMREMGLLCKDNEGRHVVSVANGHIPFLKSNESTLYIARDVAAAIDRYEKEHFDGMYYVVDNDQTVHFQNLKDILHTMGCDWADRLQHVNFGKVLGMASRKGTGLFLDDILTTVGQLVKDRQYRTHTTKVNVDSDMSYDVLATSVLVISSLRHRRVKNYSLDWAEALHMKGDSGIFLQYTHCRLKNLEVNNSLELKPHCDPSMLLEPSIHELVALIANFEVAIAQSYQDLEASILIKYLFKLSHAVNKALTILQVKGEPLDVANQRLLLFRAARNVLSKGMELVGVMPLERM